MAQRYSSEYKALQPYVVEDARSVANAVLAGASGGGSGVTDHGALTGLADDDHPQYLTPIRGDARYIPSTRTLTAGAGLTGGGDLSADRTFTVGAGYGITVNADDVALASTVAGAGLTYTTGVLAVGAGAGLTAAADSIAVGAGAGITVNADDVALTTPGTLSVSSTNVSTGNHTHAITASSSPGQAAALLKSGSNGELTLYNGFFTQGAQSAATFASGFAGSGWRADYGITTASRASIETDDLTVRGRMRVYELLIQQIRATNGSLLVTSSSKVVTVSGSTNPLWTVNGSQLTLNGSNATLTFTLYTIATSTSGEDAAAKRTYHGFLFGDIIRAQQVEWNGSAFGGVIQSNLEVTSVTNLYTYKAAFVSGDGPAVGYDFVRLGSTSDSARQGVVYLTSDDSAAPFIDIVDGVNSFTAWNSASVARVRVGKLTGISDSAFGGALSGYGLYGNNVYLRGQIVVTGGSLGGLAAADVNSNTTTIDGGRITANTITASQIAANTITAGQIAASTITAGQIAASTITSDRLNVTTLSAINANMGSLTSGSIVIGSTNKIWLNDSSDGALNIGGSTKASAPFRVTSTGDLTATSATITGTIRASTGGVTGNWYVGYDVEYAGYVYAGSGGKIRLGDDGQRLVLPNVTTFDVKVDIPTSSSALRWFSSLGLSWTSASNYTGQVCYRETTNKFVDWVAMSYVGSTDYATYYARSMLYANRYNGSTNKTCRVEAAVDPGTGGAYVTLDCDTAYATSNFYVSNNMSALSITDRTPHYDGDALAELRQVRGSKRQGIDHSSLPTFARRKVRRDDGTTEEGRDLGAMISILTVAVQQLDARLDALEGARNGR